MIVLIVSVTVFLLYLVYESISLGRWRRSIPLVITVTGTRGKSSVTRLLAAVLREDGRRVLAKTTGSEARLIWPDGSETEIRRRGPASIIEQKTLLEYAASQRVECLVAEVMSIHPENHFVESRQILQPDIVAITNVWPDHIDAMGQMQGATVSCLSRDIPGGATVFVADEACTAGLTSAVAAEGANLIVVPPGSSAAAVDSDSELARAEFAENLDLVYKVAAHVGANETAFRKGVTTAGRDIGALRIWDWHSRDPERNCLVVNGFAANDPESTRRVMAKVRDLIPLGDLPVVGLLCLRADRGDRTEQWIEALRQSATEQFGQLFVTGGHSRVVARRVNSARVLKSGSPEQLMKTVATEVEEGSIVFGFGNIAGLGRQLVDYWDLTGVLHGV